MLLALVVVAGLGLQSAQAPAEDRAPAASPSATPTAPAATPAEPPAAEPAVQGDPRDMDTAPSTDGTADPARGDDANPEGASDEELDAPVEVPSTSTPMVLLGALGGALLACVGVSLGYAVVAALCSTPGVVAAVPYVGWVLSAPIGVVVAVIQLALLAAFYLVGGSLVGAGAWAGAAVLGKKRIPLGWSMAVGVGGLFVEHVVAAVGAVLSGAMLAASVAMFSLGLVAFTSVGETGAPLLVAGLGASAVLGVAGVVLLVLAGLLHLGALTGWAAALGAVAVLTGRGRAPGEGTFNRDLFSVPPPKTPAQIAAEKEAAEEAARARKKAKPRRKARARDDDEE